MLRILISLLVLGCAQSLFAQQFHLKKYGLEEGLPRMGVFYFHQDSRGFLWIGTEGGGLCVFDGKHFKSYTRHNGLPSDNVRLILEDAEKTMWVATDAGICYFEEDRFIQVELRDSAANHKIRALHIEPTGRMWIGGDHGISFINSNEKVLDETFQIEQHFMDSTVRDFLWRDNKMWIGTDSGLYVCQNNKVELYKFQNQLAGYRIYDLFVDSDSTLWLATSGGINKIEGETIEALTTADGLANDRVRCIVEDSRGTMWFGTFQGLSVYDGENFTTVTTANGLPNIRIRCLMPDSFGNMWIGTFYGGVVRFNYKSFFGYTMAEGLGSNQVQSICEDEYGDILVGTGAGFTTLEVVGNKLYNYSTINISENYLANSIKAIYYDPQGYTWLGSARGVTVLRGDYKKEIVFQSLSAEIPSVAVTAIKGVGNRVLVGTNQGLYQVNVVGDYASFEIQNLSLNNLMGGREVSCILPDSKDRIWVGFSDGTLSVYDKTKIVTPKVPENLEMVLCMAEDSLGNIWIGTNGNGLFIGKYDSESRSMSLKNLSVQEKLSSDYIYSIVLSENNSWLGHAHGLDLLVGNADSISHIIPVGAELGFKGLQNTPNTALRDQNGNLWFGTINGLYRLNASEEKYFIQGAPPMVFLTALNINGTNEDWSRSELCDTTWGDYKLPVNLNLPYNKNNITFEFLALQYVAPEKIRYSWKLDGFDENWSFPSIETHVTYNNLDPGIYTFRVRASDELGIIHPSEETITFIIHKPFWETWWFRILAVLIITFFVLLFLRWRTRKLIEKQRKLEAVIEQRTAEVKSKNEMLEEKNKEITDSIFYSRRIQRSILPAKEKVGGLLKRYFIFFRPKDIVSGDFYWVESSPDKSQTFFAVADCTGHGVPGAMVSLIGSRALTSAVRESGLKNTAQILDAVNDSMIESFTDAATGTVIKDGMDISLCALDYSQAGQVHFQFAGAQNACWIVRGANEPDVSVNGVQLEPNIVAHGFKLFEIKADKQPIGYFEHRVAFRNNSVDLKYGDRVYLYSDGFADQFGGDKGKKFKYKTLKELILSIQNKPISDHYLLIRNAFYDWKREFEQIDDVCVMGVEV